MSTVAMNTQLDQLCINTMRFLSVDAIQAANSGHPGLPLGASPMAYVLWNRFLKHNPQNPGWFDRDRFVLSAGHGSMLIYSLLHLSGYNLTLDEIKNFRQWGSVTPGHPERGCTPGVEVTTGPLGQGFANGVGLAIAEAHLAARFNRPGHEIINHYTYALVSDGDIMEGVALEAASLAGHLKLGKMIYLYDANRITLAGSLDLVMSEDVNKRFEATGWHVLTVQDGNDLEAIANAIAQAQKETDRPSLISVHTQIGYGSPNKQGSFNAHGSPLGPDEVRLTKANLGWPENEAFHVPEEALSHFRQAIGKGKESESDWNQRFAAYEKAYPELAAELKQMMDGKLPQGWESAVPTFTPDEKLATRSASGKIMNAVAPKLPGLVGGSADLNPSTNTVLKGMGDFGHPDTCPVETQFRQGEIGGGWDYAGRNIAFGIREHSMGAVQNGIAAHGGLIPYGATFLTFSDYMRPSIRLAALSELQAIYVFTHDSIGLGEDGPTHQSVEHVTVLRAIPELVVLRPCDANETAEAWKVALENRNGPTALILTRQNVPTLDRTKYAPSVYLRKGAYILAEAPSGKPDVVLIATGSEVHLITAAQEKLAAEGIQARVVSMPSWELFDKQDAGYRESVLPPSVPKLAVEAGITMGWYRYLQGAKGDVIGVDRFGTSAPGDRIFQEFGFTVDNVVAKAKALLK